MSILGTRAASLSGHQDAAPIPVAGIRTRARSRVASGVIVLRRACAIIPLPAPWVTLRAVTLDPTVRVPMTRGQMSGRSILTFGPACGSDGTLVLCCSGRLPPPMPPAGATTESITALVSGPRDMVPFWAVQAADERAQGRRWEQRTRGLGPGVAPQPEVVAQTMRVTSNREHRR